MNIKHIVLIGGLLAPFSVSANTEILTQAGEIQVNATANSFGSGGGGSGVGTLSNPSVVLGTPHSSTASGIPSGATCIYTESVDVGFLAKAGHSYGVLDELCAAERMLRMAVTYHQLGDQHGYEEYHELGYRFVVGSARMVSLDDKGEVALGFDPSEPFETIWRP